MMTVVVDILLGSMALYIASGVLFSIYFYAKGATVLDEGTKNTSWHFKVIIFPGVVLFWSVLFIRLIKKS